MITMRISRLLFDDRRITRAVDDATRRELTRSGAIVRREALDSMRRRKGPAPPGHPPHAHKGFIKRLLLFAYSPITQSVVIGPLRIKRSPNAPHTLEYGGRVMISVRDRKRLGKRRRMVVKVEARPFMGPALVGVQDKIVGVWRDSVHIRGHEVGIS